MIFALYIPELPSLRAQSIQVISSMHALAVRGWEVELWYHRRGPDPLAGYGLEPCHNLRLRALPTGRTAASVRFRAAIVAAGRRSSTVFYARSKRYADFARRFCPRAPLVVEAHEVDSLQHDPALHALERRVLRHASALITNCPGVLRSLQWLHPLPSNRRVVHNAWLPAERRGLGEGVVLAGSLLPGKDPETVARASAALGGITLLGEHGDRLGRLQTLAAGTLIDGGPVAPDALTSTLQQFGCAILPLGTGWFGRYFTSPLKAFAYQNAGLPVVAADTPAARAALHAFIPYTPGDPDSLVRAVAMGGCPSTEQRTWADRAAEVDGILRGL